MSFKKSTTFLLCTLSIISACTNNFNTNLTPNRNTIQASAPNEGTSTTRTMTLTRVAKSTQSPTTTFDLIGDGSGEFGNVCQPAQGVAAGADPSLAATVCECSYSYSTPSRPNQKIFTTVKYHEANLLRCAYTDLPSDIKTVKISVHLTTADVYSNEVTYSFSGSNGINLDYSNPNSFVKPVRYQCRDTIFIPYIFDGKVYDPFQSEDIHLTYPIDFYASSLGDAISTYISSNNTSWNCPPILNPTDYLSGSASDPTSALATFNAANHINLNVYSKTALSGSKSIYPPTLPIDRSTFYLARPTVGQSPSGVFSIAVNSLMAPGSTTSHTDPTSPTGVSAPLGYGASPIPVGSGTGKENCPDTSVTIPAGFHWMKLWLFRASLPARHYAVSGNPPSLNDVTSIACNPGDFVNGAVNTPIYPGCDVSITHGGTSRSMADLSAMHYLADRFLTRPGICVHLGNAGGPAGGVACATPGPGCNGGADKWETTDTFGMSTNYGCRKNPRIDPLNLCPAATITSPATFNVGVGELDKGSDTSAARFDFLFVVTPPSINVADMQDNSPSSASLPYQPYRYYTDEDCGSPDPDNPAAGDCDISKAITNYGLKLHDVGSNGDPPADDPKRPGVFPVCVLQKDP